jgi:hypothetical protein
MLIVVAMLSEAHMAAQKLIVGSKPTRGMGGVSSLCLCCPG